MLLLDGVLIGEAGMSLDRPRTFPLLSDAELFVLLVWDDNLVTGRYKDFLLYKPVCFVRGWVFKGDTVELREGAKEFAGGLDIYIFSLLDGRRDFWLLTESFEHEAVSDNRGDFSSFLVSLSSSVKTESTVARGLLITDSVSGEWTA